MARLIPNQPAGKVSPQVARMFRLIKALPEDFTAWLALPSSSDEHLPQPHFFLVWQDRYCFLIQVAETSQQLAESALQADFLTSKQEMLTANQLGEDETAVLDAFASRVHPELGLDEHSAVPVRRLVVFPDVQRNTIDEIVLQRSEETQTQYLGCQHIGEEQFCRYLVKLAVDALPSYSLAVFRKHFNPESCIPASFNPLQKPQREVDAKLTDLLFDFDQEAVAKADLLLPKESEVLVNELHTRLVTGVAGSGKSLILIVRAMLMARLNQQSRLLVLTHNRPLSGELQQRFRKLTGHWPHFEWLTFFQWVKRYLPADAWPDVILSGQALEDFMRSLLAENPEAQTFSLAFLIEEMTWIKDQRLHTREAYLNAKRAGRGIPLSPAQRQVLWKLFREYQLGLEARQAIDWSGVAMRFWKLVVREQSLTLPQYDAILVDEAQFFAPAWFDCVKAALKPGGQLFLCADPTQGFLRRRQSWLASGIDVRGRTVRLDQSYRNSRSILTFATCFYNQRLGDDAEEDGLNLPRLEAIAKAPDVGAPPQVILGTSIQDLRTRLLSEVLALHERGLQPGSILILHQSYSALNELALRLRERLGKDEARLLQEGAPAESADAVIRLSTLNAGTGLEAPIVFLLGSDELFSQEQNPSLGEAERQAMVRDHTRKLYMAITRAARQLVILCRHSRSEAIFRGALQ